MTQMDLEKFLLMLDTERARLMLQDLRMTPSVRLSFTTPSRSCLPATTLCLARCLWTRSSWLTWRR
ncbi:DNA packaging protein A [Enterobacter phage 03_vB_Eclo_IJM]|nr:DNA packaging protein A [Enterobacter phage 03_vB_Eclo_IJM]